MADSISSTHVPTRASEIPGPFVERIREADQVIRAGDFVSEAAFDTVAGLADGALTAVEDGEVDVSVYDQRGRPER